MKTPYGYNSRIAEQIKQDRRRNAAPKLIESLESITETLETVCENCGWLKSDFPQIAKARAVIAEAKGDKS